MGISTEVPIWKLGKKALREDRKKRWIDDGLRWHALAPMP